MAVPRPERADSGGASTRFRAAAASLQHYWNQLQTARRHSLIDSAVRRFTYSADRHRADDRLVDLVIATETLFLGDAGNAQERGELRYRFALRAAFYLESGAPTRRLLFRFMQRANDARGAIVHGGQPSARLLRSVDGRELSLADFANALEDLLRPALHRAIAGAGSATRGALVDWDQLIIGAEMQ